MNQVLFRMSEREARSLSSIKIGFQHDENSFRLLPRSKVTIQNIEKKFHTTCYCLQDQYGAVVLPHDFKSDLLPPPHVYYIREKPVISLEPDAATEPSYVGDTAIFIENVPPEVDADLLLTWLNAGLDDEDPTIRYIHDQMENGKGFLKKLDKVMEELPMSKAVLEKGSRKERLRVQKEGLNELKRKKEIIEFEIQNLQEQLEEIKADRHVSKEGSFRLSLVASRLPPLKTSIWQLHLPADEENRIRTDVIVNKTDWNDIRLGYTEEGMIMQASRKQKCEDFLHRSNDCETFSHIKAGGPCTH